MAEWEWPQWVVVFWFALRAALGLLVAIRGKYADRLEAAGEFAGARAFDACLAAVLIFGGFF